MQNTSVLPLKYMLTIHYHAEYQYVNKFSCGSYYGSSIKVLVENENMTSRTGNAPSATRENCIEAVGRMKSGAYCRSS